LENHLLYGDLIVEGFEDIQLDVLRIEQAINEHSMLTVTGILRSEDEAEALENIRLNKAIRVKTRDGDPVFTGIITHASIIKPRDVYHIEVTAHSHTFSMDVERKSRSFQNKDMPYQALVKEVVSSYPEGAFMDKITEGAVIEYPVIQYKETDWQLCVRMASRFKSGLLPNITGEGPRFFFGLPEVDRGELVAHNYRQIKDFEFYKRLSVMADLSESDCIRYEVNTHIIYKLGDKVTFNNMPLYVVKSVCEYRNSVVTNQCLLSTKKGAQQRYIPCQNISGCSIFGKVLDVARDCIKVHLEIDDEQGVEDAYWYPYATMYASEEETGWYCMPEFFDTIRLYHPENEEKRAMAINSLKPHCPSEDVEVLDPEHRMIDPDVKYLRTAFGKEIRFRPTGIDIIAKDDTVFLTMEDDGTVTLNSNDKISLTAVNEICVKAKHINIEATDHILLKAKGSTVDLQTDIILSGKEIKTI